MSKNAVVSDAFPHLHVKEREKTELYAAVRTFI